MSSSSDFLEEQRKKKKNTQTSTSQSSSSSSASQSFLETVKSGGYKTTTPTKIKVEQPSLVKAPAEKKKESGGFIEGARQIGQSFVVGVKEAIGSLQAGAGVAIGEVSRLREENKKKSAEGYYIGDLFVSSDINKVKANIDKEVKAGKLTAKQGKERLETIISNTKANKSLTDLAEKQVDPFLSEKSKKLKEASMKTFQDAKAYELANLPIENPKPLQESIKDPLWISKTVARSVPSILASLGISAGTLVVTKNPAAALAVGYGTTYSQNAGFAYQDAKSFKATEDIAQKSAATVGTWAGLLDMLPIGRLLSRTPQGQVIKRNIVKELTKSFVIQAGLEASTESGQEIISNAVAKSYDENRDFFQNVPEAFLIGGILGGLVGGATDVATGAFTRTSKQNSDELKEKIKQIKDTPEEARSQEDKEFLAAAEDTGDTVIPPIEFLGEEGAISQTPDNLPPVIQEEIIKKTGKVLTEEPQQLFKTLNNNPDTQHIIADNVGDKFVVETTTSKLGKREISRWAVDENGDTHLIEQMPLDKAEKLYQSTDPQVIADRLVNGEWDPRTETWDTPAQESTATVKDTDELLTYINRQGFRTPEQITALKNDIIKNGIKFPIELIDNGDGTFDINDGTHRVQIAKDLGILELPVKIVKTREKTTTLLSQESEETPSQARKEQEGTGGVGESTPSSFTYTPSTNLSEEHKTIESKFGKYLTDNFTEAQARYKKMFGNVLNTDNARELSEDYSASKESRSLLSAAVHEPASAFIKALYIQELAKPGSKGINDVVFTAGGTGAGKTTAINDVPNLKAIKDNAQIVYDTNMNTLDSSIQKIDQALAAKKEVIILFVHKDPLGALRSALSRATRVGRTVPMEEHIKTHIGSPEVVLKLIERYKGNNRVEFRIINNTGKKGTAKESSFDLIKNLGYNKAVLESRLSKELERQYEKGQISKEIYTGTKGTTSQNAQGTGRRDGQNGSSQPQSQRSSKLTSSEKRTTIPSKEEPVGTGKTKNSRLFERVKESLGAEYESQSRKYNVLDLEAQANDVVNLVEDNPERAVRIARGLEEPPAGVTQNSVSIALAELARVKEDFKTAAELWTKTSLRSTRLGQEIVSLRGDFVGNEPLNAVKRILAGRTDRILKSYADVIKGLALPEGATSGQKVEALIKHQTKRLKKEMENRFGSADQMFEALTCK